MNRFLITMAMFAFAAPTFATEAVIKAPRPGTFRAAMVGARERAVQVIVPKGHHVVMEDMISTMTLLPTRDHGERHQVFRLGIGKYTIIDATANKAPAKLQIVPEF